MGQIAPDVIALLQYLLPGFIAAWVFHGLTPYPRASEFERIVQALIFTMFVVPFAAGLEHAALWLGKFRSIGPWTTQSSLVASVLAALLIGSAFSFLANTDLLHKMLRLSKITQETSYPSEWFGAFLTRETYIVLHLKDERRLYGWPREWPSGSKTGHFLLQQPTWLVEHEYQRINGAESLLIGVEEVRWIEFVEKYWENTDEEELESTATNTRPSGSEERS